MAYAKYKKYKEAYRNYIYVMAMSALKRKRYAVMPRILGMNTPNHYERKYVLPAWLAYCLFISPYIQTPGKIDFHTISYDKKSDELSFTFEGKSVKLVGTLDNGDIVGVFFDEDYSRLNVNNCVVIDVGANIGDTPIYFSLRRAKEVYAFEPYPHSYGIAAENIRLNAITNIHLFNIGLGNTKKKILVDRHYKSGLGSDLREFNTGAEIDVLSLSDVLKLLSKDDMSFPLILKMDCEGCEYDAILNAPQTVLEKFHVVQIEYHYGYDELKKRLEESGFLVEITTPLNTCNKQAKRSNMAVGWILAFHVGHKEPNQT